MSKNTLGYITDHPFMMNLWSNNNSIDPSKYRARSNKRALWKCSSNHEWEAIIANIYKGRKCPYCSNKKIAPGLNDLFTENPEAKKFWSNKNTIDPTTISRSSSARAIWVCNLGHEWESFVNNFNKGYRCPYCVNKKILRGYNDLATLRPDLLEWWSPNNTLDPSMIAKSTNRYALWMCKSGHEWKEKCSNIASSEKRRCPYCSGHKVIKGFNSLSDTHPKLKELGADEDTMNIRSAGSNYKIKLKCPKTMKEYYKIIYDAVYFYPHCGCEGCAHGRSKPEKDLASFVESLGFTIEVSDRSIIKPLELDIVIPSLKVAIEFNGMYWHSDEVIKNNKSMSSYDFHKLKKDLAREAGYELLFVWEDDWNADSQAVKNAVSEALQQGSQAVRSSLLTRLS